jgi:twitching motility protein PilT
MPIDFNLLKTLAGHNHDVNSVAFSRDNRLLASGGGDGTVRIWDVASHQMLLAAEHGAWINSVCFAPSGQAFASGARDGSVKLWSAENAQLFGSIQAHTQNVSSTAFSPDGRRLASGGGDGHVRIFNLREKKIERAIAAHTGWAWCVAFSSLGDRLLTCGGDRVARLWSAERGHELTVFEGHLDDVLYAAFSPDDRFVATAGKDGTARLWETDTGRQLVSLAAHEGAVNCVAFSPDGQHLATAGADHVLSVWHVESGQKVRDLTGHQDYVAAAVFARDGKYMASCGGDGTVKIWEATERSAYAASADARDPGLEIEHEDAGSRAEVYSSLYAAGKVIAETSLKNGIKITLHSARDKYTIAVGESQRTVVTVTGEGFTVTSGTGTALLRYDLGAGAVTFDRTDGAAAPWAEERDGATEAAFDPNLERTAAAAAGSALNEMEFEIERAGGGASAYQSFERLGKSLARERIGASGRVLRLVHFDADTVYVLFDQAEEPTIVLKGEHLDVRDGTSKPVFRMHLRSLEPVISRKGSGEPVATAAAPAAEPQRDPLVVQGLAEMGEEAGARINKILEKAVWAKASDIHIPSGAQVLVRRHGLLQPLGVRQHTPAEIEALVLGALTPEQRRIFAETNDLDFSYEIPNVGRFRANVCRQHRGVDATFRVIPDVIPEPESLGLPPAVLPLTRHHNGLVLITGPAGQGKSTTIACLVDQINSSRPVHIITVEDPIEFVHPVKVGVVNQREVGRHTMSFANALRAALREDPDVIVVGEMRDLETIALAITASETGHLVFGSLMTSSAAQTVDRILDSFPAGQQAQIRTMLSESLRGVVSQQLLPTASGEGRVLACEVLLGTPAVANLIRERKTFQIASVMQTSRNIGMQRMDDALFDLVQAGRITPDTAIRYAQDGKSLETRLRPRAAAPEPGAGMRRP